MRPIVCYAHGVTERMAIGASRHRPDFPRVLHRPGLCAYVRGAKALRVPVRRRQPNRRSSRFIVPATAYEHARVSMSVVRQYQSRGA